MSPRPRVRRTAARRGPVVGAIALSLVIGLGATAPARADDPVPSQDEVDAAQSRVSQAAADVATMDVQIAQLEATQATALQDAALAGSAYNQAVVDLDAAVGVAEEATTKSEEAAARAEESRKLLVGIARENSRNGGGLDQVGMFLAVDGVQDAVSEANAMDKVGSKADKAVQQFQADTSVAQTLKGIADEAVADQQTKKEAADTALASAQQKQSEADAAVLDASTQRSTLVSALASARSTSIEVEQQRQDGLAAQRAAAAEEAARARVEREVVPVVSPAAPAAPVEEVVDEPGEQAPETTPPTETTPPPTTPTTPPAAEPTTPPATTPPPTTPPVVTPPPVVAPPVVRPPAPTPPPVTPPVVRPPTTGGSSSGSAAQGQAAVDWAKTQTGLPYVWGATGPAAYDCSGLTSRAWANAGLGIPRTSRDQYSRALKISLDSMRPGDLVFWASNTNDPSTIFHVAMYAGNGQIVEAAQPGVLSRVTHMRWNGTLMPFAGRP